MAGPTVATIKRLFAVSGNRCTFPGCELPLVDEASGNVLGEICHIRARSPDGPRYYPEQTEEERHGFENLVLLCPTHHAIVDGDAGTYTVEELLRIKAEHEARHAGGAEPSDEVARRWLPPFTVPPDLATFTGREKLLEELDGLLQPGGTASVAIVGLKGMAGVGKSALAVHAAHTWRERFPDGVAWVDLRAERGACDALRHVAGLYGYRKQAAELGDDRQALTALMRTVLQGKRALLILDNAEGWARRSWTACCRGWRGR